jgi:succinate dehydrogenase/fumarate reductase flavoprotein subunit
MPDLARRLALQSGALVDWLVDVAGARLTLLADVPAGHGAARLHTPPSGGGQALVDDLGHALAQRGIPIWFGWPVSGVIGDQDGIVGAVSDAGPEAIARIRARAVVLASGGFAGAPALLRRFCPDASALAAADAPSATGDALLWGFGLRAALANLGAFQTDPETGALLRSQGGLKVDGSGRVLRDDGAPIPSLFAGGGAAAGISGRRGGAGYLAGNALLCALGLGLIAGRAAAAEAAR